MVSLYATLTYPTRLESDANLNQQHGVDHILLPPPSVATILSVLPGEFSTLTLGLTKTGLLKTLNTTQHAGGTFFVPTNFAFQKLGHKINAFLFSQFGEKYLLALLKYHIILNNTLYSNAFYGKNNGTVSPNPHIPGIHYELPTLLENKNISVAVTSYGPVYDIRVNGFTHVKVQDGLASDGVLQIVTTVLIPPRKNRDGVDEHWQGEPLTVEELRERLEPYVPNGELTQQNEL